ncbi:MAG TPA: peptidyl-prolyl cis-trans isomerase [Candidatus Angelobacter sp.]|nr:peptidyl-prolyl cis-trans isomerase [Candidatus Angelobacter sp.]
MMRIRIAPILLAVCMPALGQGTTASVQPRPGTPLAAQPGTTAHPEAVDAKDAVITVHGFCPEASASNSGACTTVITKEQFERTLAAVNQANAPMSPAAIRNLAERYVQIMAFASQAEKLGLDKDPRFQELMRVVRLNSLTEAYHRAVDEKYRTPSDADIQAYYDKNIAKFEQVKLGRVFIPRVNPKAPREGPNDFEQRAQKLAESMRDRAANDEELDKLQQEAYKTLGLTAAPITTELGTRRRGTLPPNVENEIFSLKSGEVTKVEPEPAGFQFYKLQARETLTVAQAKTEIVAAIRKEAIEAANKAVMDPIHTDLNEAYFGPRSAGTPFTMPQSREPQHPPVAPAAAPNNAPKPVEP